MASPAETNQTTGIRYMTRCLRATEGIDMESWYGIGI